MTWHPSISSEIADTFGALSWRHDDYQRSLEEWAAWTVARNAEREAIRLRFDNRARRLERQARYRAKHRVEAVERTRQWRLANRERARELAREQERRRRERAKADPVFGAKYRAIINASRKRARERMVAA